MSILNLLPEDYIQRRRTHRANMLCLGLFAVVMTGVVAAAVVSQRSSANTQKVLDRINGDYQDATRLIAELQELQAQKQTMMRKAEMTATLLERVPRSYLLAVVTNSLPKGASLTKFDLSPKRIVSAPDPRTDPKFAAKSGAAPSAPKQVVEMEITGMACTDVEVARFMTNLARSPLASSVDLVYSQEKLAEMRDNRDDKVLDKRVVREFQIRVQLRSDLDVIDVIGKDAAQAAGQPEGNAGAHT